MNEIKFSPKYGIRDVIKAGKSFYNITGMSMQVDHNYNKKIFYSTADNSHCMLEEKDIETKVGTYTPRQGE